MEYVDYVLRALAYFLPYAACVFSGGYIEAKYGQKIGQKIALAAQAELSAVKAELAALKAKL